MELVKKGYKLYNLKTEKIVISRDVVFNENACWVWKTNTERSINVLIPEEAREVHEYEENSVKPEEVQIAPQSP